jgi:hypothetical protein
LIDPTDITIDATTCTGTNCIDAATISSTLDNTDVSIATDASGTDAGDINVNASISKASGTGTTTLTLSAHNNININADITASSGVLNLNLAANIADNSGKIAFTNGSLVIDLFDGVLYTYGGSTVNVVNATTDISGNNIDLKNLTWNNAGTVNFNVSDATTFLNLTDSTLNNSGTFNDNSNASSYAFIKSNGTTDIINNTGTWNKSGTTATTISTEFNNTGTVNINNYHLYLTGTGVDTGSYVISSSNSSLLNFGATSRNLNSGASISGDVRIYQGSTTFNTDLSIDNLIIQPFSTGTLNISSSTLTVNDLDFLSSTGVITGGGTGVLSIPSGGTIDASAGSTVTAKFDNLTINNSGTFNFTAGTLNIENNSTFNNFGLFDFRGDLSVSTTEEGTTSTFNNFSNGTIKKSVGVGTSTLDIIMGQNSGTIDLGASNTSLSFPNNGSAITLTGGEIIGQGGIIADIINTGATISPASTGTVGNIAITGSYTQTSGSGKLEFEATSSGTADSLSVTAVSSITAGTLELINLGYTPSDNDTFDLITCNTSTCLSVSPTINDFSGVDNSSTSIIASTPEIFRYTVDAIGSIWTGDDGDDLWSTAANWTTAPTTNSNVYIPSGFDVDGPIIYDASAGTLSINSLDLNGDSDFTLSGGSLSVNSATFESDTTFALTGGTFSIDDDSSVNLNGSFNWTGGTISRGATGSSAGTFNLSSSAIVNFNSAGTPILNGPTIDASGSLNINAGSLTIQSGSISSGSNAITIGENASVSMTTGSINSGDEVIIDGSLSMAGGNIGSESGITINSTGSLTITGAASIDSITNQGTIYSYGTPTFNSTFANQGSLNILAGTVNIDFYGSFSQSAGSTTINTGAKLDDGGSGTAFSFTGGNLTSIGTMNGDLNFDNGTLSTGNEIGTFLINGDVSIGSSSVVAVKLGGTTQGSTYDFFDVENLTIISGAQLDISLVNGFSGTVGDWFDVITMWNTTPGTFTLNTPTGYSFTDSITTPESTFYSLNLTSKPKPPAPLTPEWIGSPETGSYLWSDANNWTILPVDGDNITIPSLSGDVTVVFDTSVSLGSLTVNESFNITGGSLFVDSGSFASGTTFNLSGGSFGSDGSVNVLGNFNWSGGSLTGSGTLDLTSATSAIISGNVSVGTMTFNASNLDINSGQLTYGTNLNASTYNVANGAAISVPTGTLVADNIALDGDLVVSNASVSASSISVTSTGGIQTSGASTISATVTNQGTIDAAGTTTYNGAVTNTGTVQSNSGNLKFANSYVQDAGATILNGGDIEVQNMIINGGYLGGTGTITGSVVNNAELRAGFSPGTISITGNYDQSSTGSIQAEIAGSTSGDYDVLNVSGGATLAGTFNVIPIEPFASSPTTDGSYNLINAGTITDNGITVTAPTGYGFDFSFSGGSFGGSITSVPGTVDPGTVDPGTVDPGTVDPGTVDPGTVDPGTVDGVSQPVIDEVIDIQTTDVLTLTENTTVENNVLEDDEEETFEHSSIAEATTDSSEEIAGALQICQ